MTKNNINWRFLLDNLEAHKCILCVGPDIYDQAGKPRFENQLAAFLRSHETSLNIRVYDNGWFHFLPEHNPESVWKKLAEFYKKPYEEADAIMEKLAGLPFEAVISFVPDYRLRNIFAAKRPYTQFKAFQKIGPCVAETPSVEKPLIFNMLGHFQKGESLVLTYKDFYDYLKSVFAGHGIPETLKEKINDANHFIFLGLPFDKWYTHMFMSIINDSVNKTGNRSIHRVGANPFLEQDDKDRASEQYGLTIVEDNISDFVNDLFERCKDENILVEGTGQAASPLSIFDVWRKSIKSGGSDEITEVLDNMEDMPDLDKEDTNEVLLLRSRYRRFLKDKNHGKFETTKAEYAVENGIVDGILHLISVLEKQTKKLKAV